MKPAVSVCVPTYNGTRYLRECLDSILAQTYENYEIIVVDNQSADGTFDLAREYAAHDARIRLFRNPQNLGMVENRHRCMDLADGEWIKFVFQDDRIAPQCLEYLFKESRRDVPLTVCQTWRNNSTGQSFPIVLDSMFGGRFSAGTETETGESNQLAAGLQSSCCGKLKGLSGNLRRRKDSQRVAPQCGQRHVFRARDIQ